MNAIVTLEQEPWLRTRSGDLVEIRAADEILQTLDAEGTLDGLPFMPEMVEFCGGRYRVFQRVPQAVIDTALLRPHYVESYVREFKKNDVVVLQGLRCSGGDHDGCSRGCLLFWKEAWLRKVPDAEAAVAQASEPDPLGRSRLRTIARPGVYFCQSSQILKATNPLSARQRLGKWFAAVGLGNCSLWGMMQRTLVWTYWRMRRRLFGEWPRGELASTPSESLGLRAGELVRVKALPEIVRTLDKNGRNRGLHFSADMALHCGKQYHVRCRAEKWITEGTGQMRQLRNTVILEGATCDSSYYAFGGCPRCDFQYWREIWLQRVV